MKRIFLNSGHASVNEAGGAGTQMIFDAAKDAVVTIDAISRDMVQLKECIRRHDENESHAQAILQHAPVAIITTNGQGMIESANHEAERLFGYAARDMLGRNFSFLIPREDGRCEVFNREHVVPGPWLATTQSRTSVARRRDGRHIAVEVSTSHAQLGVREVVIAVVRETPESRSA